LEKSPELIAFLTALTSESNEEILSSNELVEPGVCTLAPVEDELYEGVENGVLPCSGLLFAAGGVGVNDVGIVGLPTLLFIDFDVL
jgi:hypothetical protein